ncbi:hypothetical protein FUA23_00395 [Neolewinella aurantiaca]|uniref:Uncharacterized protein n=1 Tax=Neolewinella aurantiaca TaxID=2602767 RepID=A0A5C7FNC6_9BACT|nr:hypothetical protein [Neolewinella aurantiaca]TXF91677.1 hypothetical protein FUA23_00395 [Neolewinella aurantiaca]
MLRFTLLFVLSCSVGHFVQAQTPNPTMLKTPGDHAAFFDTIREMHQELVQRSGPVILAHGWESAEHLALRDSTLSCNARLRMAVDNYLDLYGFPVPSADATARRKLAQAELVKLMTEEANKRMTTDLLRDSAVRDSIVAHLASRYGEDITFRDTRPTVMLILDTEPDFGKRCEHIPWLRYEWEEGNLPTETMLTYLRHTYSAKHGIELDIAPGSTERERILMHARELSGCWGN